MKKTHFIYLTLLLACVSCNVPGVGATTTTTTPKELTLSGDTLQGIIIIFGFILLVLAGASFILEKVSSLSVFNLPIFGKTTKVVQADSSVVKVVGEKTLDSSSKLDKIVAEKKEKLLGIPNVSFHYVDREQVQSFYNDYFKEPTVESLVSEITGELTSQAKGGVPQVIEAKVGGKDLSKWISTVKIPDISLNGMFVRYQRETIKSGQVTLGLEEIDIELNELQAFDEAIKEFERRYSFAIDEDLLNGKRLKIKEKAAERTLNKLEQANGWVLVEGRFRIEKKDDFYKLTYLHPVNEFITNLAVQVSVSISIPIDGVEAQFAGNYSQSVGGLIPIRVYGQVWQPINRKADVWNLQLTPLAVY